MKKTLLLGITVCLLFPLRGQQYYKFSELKSSYTELNEATVADTHDFINDALTHLPVQGETFNLFGTDFTFGGTKTMRIQTYGDLRIDNDTSAIIIDGVFTSLIAVDTTTKISYKIEGPSGQKIVKVQWKNVRIDRGPVDNFCNFQIWIHQQYGVVELRYGPRSENNGSGYTSSTGPYAGLFFSNNTFNTLYEKLWLHGSPTNIRQDSSASFSFNSLLGVPSDGTIWRFTPKQYLDSVYIGVAEQALAHTHIAPNPASTYLTVQGLPASDRTNYRIFNVTGKKFKEGNLSSNNEKIEIEHLPAGIYLLQLDQSGKYSQTHRFIKE
jgi:hypothetical protein